MFFPYPPRMETSLYAPARTDSFTAGDYRAGVRLVGYIRSRSLPQSSGVAAPDTAGVRPGPGFFIVQTQCQLPALEYSLSLVQGRYLSSQRRGFLGPRSHAAHASRERSIRSAPSSVVQQDAVSPVTPGSVQGAIGMSDQFRKGRNVAGIAGDPAAQGDVDRVTLLLLPQGNTAWEETAISLSISASGSLQSPPRSPIPGLCHAAVCAVSAPTGANDQKPCQDSIRHVP